MIMCVFYAYIIITIVMVTLLGIFGVLVCMTDGKTTASYSG
jgi:hypothetical protein